MDSIIYNYLIKNQSHKILTKDDYDNENQIFLECLLILSTNRINIDYNTLLQYCDYNNNKRNLNIDSDDNLYYGLNDNQFKILHKIIKSFDTINDEIMGHQLSNNNISKLDYAILMIIENNLKLHQTGNNKILSEAIKLNNNNNSKALKVPSKNSRINEIDYYQLFKKVWGNLTIRNEIKFHLRLFNFHNLETSISYKQLKEYKYRNYITCLKLISNELNNRRVNWNFIKKKNRDEHKFEEFTIEHCKYISSSVKRLELIDYHQINENSIPSTVSTLILLDNINQKLTNNLFSDIIISGDNITQLIFGNDFNQSLSTGPNENESWLPKNLTSLTIGRGFQQSIYPGQLPNSLSSLILDKVHYKGTIIPNSIPKSVTTLDYTFNSKDNKIEINKFSIPKCTTNLTFDDQFNQTIEPGFIPHNVTSLKFGRYFNNTIQNDSLPLSLRSIEFGCSFNQPTNDKLPSNLTSLTFGDCFNNLEMIIPSSITKLHFGSFYQPIYINTFKSLKNLNDLKFKCPRNQTENIRLPNSIKTLYLHDDGSTIHANLLPKSLTHLTCTLNSNLPLLPDSITSLSIFNQVNQTNIPLPLPSNLKSITLSIKNQNNNDLSQINFPESLESIYVRKDSFPLFNNLPIDFLLKYIKPIEQ